MRISYLSHIKSESIDINVEFEDEVDNNDIINAALTFACEQKAVSYLARTEHSRFMLETKLFNKNHSKEAIRKSLDYLEQKGYLDDARFSRAWLRNRSITKTEGPSRLSIELAKRGVNRDIIKEVLGEYFLENNIEDLFQKAVDRLQRIGKKGDKLQQALIRQGFEWKLIKSLEDE